MAMTTSAATASAILRPRRRFVTRATDSFMTSEPDADREVQPHFARLLAVRDVEPERADRRLHARADAVALRQPEMRQRVERIARVDECGDSPVIVDPARRLDARDGVVAHGEDRVTLLQAKAFERVAAYGRIAARAEQELGRYVVAIACDHGARFGARGERPLSVDRLPVRVADDRALESARRHAGDARADLCEHDEAFRGRCEIVDAPPCALDIDVQRVRACRGQSGWLLAIGVQRR